MALIYPDTDSWIEIGEGYNKNKPTACFYMKQLKMELIGGRDDKPLDCVSFQGIHDESIFILCQNFDIKSNPQ